jgi:hypothetical protein
MFAYAGRECMTTLVTVVTIVLVMALAYWVNKDDEDWPDADGI